MKIIDSLCEAGSNERLNEDALGYLDFAAFVIDGATGLGPNVITGEIGTDAAWLAEFCRVHFLEMLKSGSETKQIVAITNELVGHLLAYSSFAATIEPWQRPIAGFQMLRQQGNILHLEGLGDCVAYVQMKNGATDRISPVANFTIAEIQTARQAIARAGSIPFDGSIVGGAETLAIERALRATFNTPGGPLWTLGSEPSAAHHMHCHPLHADQVDFVLLCTDGFAALTDKYHRYDAAGLISKAVKDGLATLYQELRHIEHNEDPNGHMHPRMKRSDDATAILIAL